MLGSLSQQSMSLEDKLANWNTTHDDQDAEEFAIAPRYQEVRSFLLNSVAFRWLVQRAQSAAILTDPRGTALETITHTMNAAFASSKSLKARSDQSYRVHFSLDWDYSHFLRNQEYDTDHKHMERAITIIGRGNEAQATTCGSYMDQVWPSTGRELVQALQTAAISGAQQHESFSSGSSSLPPLTAR
jgi:hypothetical protein